MLTLEPFSEDQGRSAVHPARGIPPISFLAPCGFTHPLTRTHVRLLGPCFKTGRMGCPQAGAGSTQRVVPPDLGSRSKHPSQDDTLGSSSRASLTAHDARHNTRVFSTTTSRASTEGDSSLGQPHHKHGRPISAPMPCVPIRGAWLGRRDA
ncbi:hypothetical protein L2E82_53401 [Cichorium intybus]|nr:hypothetical protein L2E82_53401 [Cichorium intybus]